MKNILDKFKIVKEEEKDYSVVINEESITSNIIEIVLGIFLVIMIIVLNLFLYRGMQKEEFGILEAIVVLSYIPPFIFFFISHVLEEIIIFIYRLKAKDGKENDEDYLQRRKVMKKIKRVLDYLFVYSFIIMIISFIVGIIVYNL